MATGDTTALLRSIRRHTHIPDTHPGFTDADTLADATEELHSYLLPLGMGERQELWAGPTGRMLLTLEEGVAFYAIPGRAAGNKLRAVRLTDGQGNPVHVETVGREDMQRWRPETGEPRSLVLEGGGFRLYPTPRNLSGYTLHADVYLRPAELVLAAECGVVESVSSEPGTTTLLVIDTDDNAPLYEAGTFDVVSASAPFDTLAVDAIAISVQPFSPGLTEVVLDGEFTVAMGDYLCLPGKAPVVQAPLEWHPLLALKTAVRQLASLGDLEAAGAKGQEGGQKEKQAATLIRPRREDVARKPRNGMDRFRGPWGY